MLDLEPFAWKERATRTRTRFRETDVNGIGDKPALVSTIELMDDRTPSILSNFPTPTLFPFVDFRFIGFLLQR